MGDADRLPLAASPALIDAPLHRIGVFRALVLGDLLCATPALRAVRAAHPAAEISLIGLPWARELAARLPEVDRFVAFPGFPGLPEVAPDLGALPSFFAESRAHGYDLLLQLHGSGGLVNNLLAACGPRHTAGFVEPGGYAQDPRLHTPWPERGTEVERLLAATDHLGFARQGTALAFPLHAEDHRALCRAWPGIDAAGDIVCVHVGAQLPSRRWPIERYAAVADALADDGHTVVYTGTAAEAPLVASARAAMRAPSVDLAGRTGLWTLGALIARARLLVCNDTGVSHVAAALRCRSVVVSSGGDAARWAPEDTSLHTVLWHEVPCRPCAHRACPFADHPCATAVEADTVVAAARRLLASSPRLAAL